jgi:hypothetical protein
MTRSKTEPTEPEQPASSADTDTDTSTTTTAAAEADTSTAYEPYPGAVFFHGGRNSPIVAAMAHRLYQEACTDTRPLGRDWTNAHRDAFAAWQRQLRPKGAGDVSGIPDETAWDRLHVPRTTPLPKES